MKDNVIGMTCRLNCLKTIKGQDQTDGINFVIVEEREDEYEIMLPTISTDLVMTVKKSDVTII